jgi:hypothetical protein
MEVLAIIAAILALVAFDVASLRRGASSIEGFNSPEWDRRRAWRGFSSH